MFKIPSKRALFMFILELSFNLKTFWGIWGIFSQTISTILALWVPYPWESVAGSLSYKKLWFVGLKHATPKYSQNKIWAVQSLENSVRTSVFGAYNQWTLNAVFELFHFSKINVLDIFDWQWPDWAISTLVNGLTLI